MGDSDAASSSSMAGGTKPIDRQPGGGCAACSSAGQECVWSGNPGSVSCPRCEEMSIQCVPTKPMGPPPTNRVKVSPSPRRTSRRTSRHTRSGDASDAGPSTSQQSTSAGPTRDQKYPGLVADFSGSFARTVDRLEGIHMNIATNTRLQIDQTLRLILRAIRAGDAEAEAANVHLAAAAEAAGVLAGAAILAVRAQPDCYRMSRADIFNAQSLGDEQAQPGSSSLGAQSRGDRAPSQ